MDASNVEYTAPFTGAVPRTLADKLAETISVADFGAVPNGDPIQTQAAFEAAIAAVKDYANVRHHVLHIPAGRWNLNSTLQLSDNLAIKGANRFGTRLLFPNLSLPLVSLRRCTNTLLEDIHIGNGSAVSGSVALDMTDAYSCSVSRIQINNADIGVKLYGLYDKGAYYNDISDVIVSSAVRVGFLVDSAVAHSNVNSNVIRGCGAYHAQVPFAILSGNNNSFHDCRAETLSAIEKYFIVDKTWGTVITNPRAEKGGAGAAGIGIHVTSNALGTTIIEGNLQNLGTTILNQGQGTTHVTGGYTPPVLEEENPAQPGAARYWGVVKTNPAAGGSYHTELQVEDANGPVPVVYSMMYSQHDLTGVLWARLIDGDLSAPAFHTDSADPGAHFRLDFGAPVELRKWRFYVSGPVSAVWNVVKSHNGSSWMTVATGLNCSGGAGWKEISW